MKTPEQAEIAKLNNYLDSMVYMLRRSGYGQGSIDSFHAVHEERDELLDVLECVLSCAVAGDQDSLANALEHAREVAARVRSTT